MTAARVTEEIRLAIAGLAQRAKALLPSGSQYKATVLLRATHLDRAEVLVTEDDEVEVLLAISRAAAVGLQRPQHVPGSTLLVDVVSQQLAHARTALQSARRTISVGHPVADECEAALQRIDDLEALKAGAAKEIAQLRADLQAYIDYAADKRRLTRELDVAMHGVEGAAQQASLCDLVGPARDLRTRLEQFSKRATEARRFANFVLNNTEHNTEVFSKPVWQHIRELATAVADPKDKP